ncbi:AI-2E family transporter [Bacillaceae bacterium S4-13-56]
MLSKDRLIHWMYFVALGILILIFSYLLFAVYPYIRVVFSFVLKIATPLLISAFIAYLLHPIVESLHRQRIPRWLAILIIYSFFFGGIGWAIYKGYPLLVHQIKDLNEQVPQFIQTYREWISLAYEQTAHLPEAVHDRMDELFVFAETKITELLEGTGKKVTNMMAIIINVAVIPVLVFYMLKDYPLIWKGFYKLIPSRRKEKAHQVISEMDKSLGNYIRGQLLVCFCVGLVSFILLWLIGMKYPLLLSLFMGLTNVIPYFGPIIGAAPALILGITVSFRMALYVLGAVVIVQIIESNLLSPFIVGKSLHIHPIFIIIALLVGGEVGGIIGMILAVPVLTVLKVLVHQSRIALFQD